MFIKPFKIFMLTLLCTPFASCMDKDKDWDSDG